jgi:hypothetical protein
MDLDVGIAGALPRDTSLNSATVCHSIMKQIKTIASMKG